MDEQRRERWIHGDLDGDLTPAEREAFEAECVVDPELRAALERARVLKAGLGGLPRPAGPEGLSDRIMAQLAHREPATRWWELLLRPVPVPALALGLMACAIAAAIWFASRPSPPLPQDPTTVALAPPEARPAAPVCPAPMPLQVRFVLHAPGARQVALAGDFNAWTADRHLLYDEDDNGTWTLTVPLSPGRYQYKFVVDGQWVVDPDASGYMSDGFGGRNAVLNL